VAPDPRIDADDIPELLVLDVGGVLYRSVMPGIVAEIALAAGTDEERLRRHVDTELFHGFWSGRMSIGAFWARLGAFAGGPARPTEGVPGRMCPLPALARLPDWSRHVRLGVLSNHRGEWARPALARAGVLELLDPVLISSETGLVKPGDAAFAQLVHLGVPPSRILYVDDRAAALRGAERAGVRTLWADPAGRWAGVLDDHLGGLRRAATG